MTQTQKIIKYSAITLAVLLIVGMALGLVRSAAWLFLIIDDGRGEDEFYDMQAIITDYDSDELSLDVDIGASELIIQNGESFEVSSNGRYIVCRQRGERLVIEERPHISFGVDAETRVIITLPPEFFFKNVDMDIGAGEVSIETLWCETLELDLGTGNCSIDSLAVTRRADIDGGAGMLRIDGGSISDLDLDMGVGGLDLTAALLGNTDLDMGVGNVDLNILGDERDYRLDIDKGLGSVHIGERLFSGGVLGNGTNRVDIDGGIGDIDVVFVPLKR